MSLPALAERRAWNGDDVRLLEQARGERVGIGAPLDAGEGEEPRAGRRPRQRRYRRNPVGDELPPSEEFVAKPARIAPVVAERTFSDHLRHRRSTDDHRVLDLGGLLADGPIGEQETDSPAHERERL